MCSRQLSFTLNLQSEDLKYLDLFVLIQEVTLNQFSSEEYLSDITARLLISAPFEVILS